MPTSWIRESLASLILIVLAASALFAEDESSPENRLASVLAGDTDLQFVETSLKDVIALLRFQLKINLVLDTRALQDSGFDEEDPVSIDLKKVQVGTGLRLLLRSKGLTCQTRGGLLVVTTPEAAEAHLNTNVYDVKDLIGDRDNDALLETITTVISLDSWEDVGGSGTIREFENAIVVAQTDEIHGRIVQLLSELRAALSRQATHSSRTGLHQRLHSKRIDLKFENKPLRKILEQVATTIGAPLFVDEAKWGIDARKLNAAMTLSLSGEDVLADLLDALAQRGLTLQLDGGVLVLASLEEAESHYPVVVYNVRDLVSEPESGGYDYDTLMDVLLGAVAVDSWDDVGGPGSVVAFRGALVIYQSEANHLAIAQLLEQLRHKGESFPTAVDKALQSRTTLQLNDVSLVELLDVLSKRHKLKFKIDRAACDEQGVDPNPRVRCDLSDTRVSTALSFILDPLDLAIAPGSSRVVVTTKESARTRLLTRTYWLGEWTHAGDSSKAEKLAATILESIKPSSWDEMGGYGALRLYGDRLVVSQTYAVHLEVKDLLAKLRRARQIRDKE